jgi:hypothetical protein
MRGRLKFDLVGLTRAARQDRRTEPKVASLTTVPSNRVGIDSKSVSIAELERCEDNQINKSSDALPVLCRIHKEAIPQRYEHFFNIRGDQHRNLI